ncbi:MAG TPA: HAMP domain-containing sensor histidine kinase [Candidatus Kapabacteria bacterium]|nr:HAMP domain-containing sensor histidine kinase [Candidatus Kapabacteria bacterium]
MATPASTNIKFGLVLTALVLVLGILWYAQSIVRKLQDRERDSVAMLADIIQNSSNATETQTTDYTFFLTHILSKIDFPMIIADTQNVPAPPFAANIRNIVLDTTLTKAQQAQFLQEKIYQFDKKYTPLPIYYIDPVKQDTLLLSYIHYGDSPLITELQYLPYVEISIGILFVLIGYIGFSHIKRAEQSSIWAGMARETAHQLGTPLSSMMGWTELLAARLENNPDATETINELRNDLERLQKITDRFSKIGSKPERKLISLNEVVYRVVKYIERRLPQMKKSVAITVHEERDVHVMLNAELFEWVIENLLKNALDAIEAKGKIDVTIGGTDGEAFVDVHDTGKGIDARYRKDVFRPGYSTKRRGWGLGLSLSKRIVEEYHEGKIYVKTSGVGKGTTFRIELKTD